MAAVDWRKVLRSICWKCRKSRASPSHSSTSSLMKRPKEAITMIGGRADDGDVRHGCQYHRPPQNRSAPHGRPGRNRRRLRRGCSPIPAAPSSRKRFQSGADAELVAQLKRDFASVRSTLKPASSRRDSWSATCWRWGFGAEQKRASSDPHCEERSDENNPHAPPPAVGWIASLAMTRMAQVPSPQPLIPRVLGAFAGGSGRTSLSPAAGNLDRLAAGKFRGRRRLASARRVGRRCRENRNHDERGCGRFAVSSVW